MGAINSNIVSCEWVLNNINKIGIIDSRFKLGNPKYASNSYNQSHLPNAVYVDLEHELTGDVLPSRVGGRHPLPTADILKSKMEELGIDDSTDIVVYDDGDLAGAARLWWLLKYFGKDNVKVMNGGIEEWKRLGYELSTEKSPMINTISYTDKKKTLSINVKDDMLVFQEDVKAVINNENTQLIDSRAPERYRGEIEPIDRVPGRIPSAINIPFNCAFGSGLVPSIEELKKFYKTIDASKNQIVYCGSGITGAVNVLLLSEQGIEAKLYAGSYSDWVSNLDNSVEI